MELGGGGGGVAPRVKVNLHIFCVLELDGNV